MLSNYKLVASIYFCVFVLEVFHCISFYFFLVFCIFVLPLFVFVICVSVLYYVSLCQHCPFLKAVNARLQETQIPNKLKVMLNFYEETEEKASCDLIIRYLRISLILVTISVYHCFYLSFIFD